MKTVDVNIKCTKLSAFRSSEDKRFESIVKMGPMLLSIADSALCCGVEQVVGVL